uniref:Uncharacterized protein n=1 Tax=Arundo donax TaxID=35708 RepID=A0A0A9A7V7_ARUDO
MCRGLKLNSICKEMHEY